MPSRIRISVISVVAVLASGLLGLFLLWMVFFASTTVTIWALAALAILGAVATVVALRNARKLYLVKVCPSGHSIGVSVRLTRVMARNPAEAIRLVRKETFRAYPKFRMEVVDVVVFVECGESCIVSPNQKIIGTDGVRVPVPWPVKVGT